MISSETKKCSLRQQGRNTLFAFLYDAFSGSAQSEVIDDGLSTYQCMQPEHILYMYSICVCCISQN